MFSALFSIDEDVCLTVACPGVLLASNNDICLGAGCSDYEGVVNNAVASLSIGKGGCQRTEGGRCVSLEEGVISYIVGNNDELIEALAAIDSSIIAVAVVDSEVESIDAWATV